MSDERNDAHKSDVPDRDYRVTASRPLTGTCTCEICAKARAIAERVITFLNAIGAEPGASQMAVVEGLLLATANLITQQAMPGRAALVAISSAARLLEYSYSIAQQVELENARQMLAAMSSAARALPGDETDLDEDAPVSKARVN